MPDGVAGAAAAEVNVRRGLNHSVDELGAMFAEPGQGIAEVVHGEHSAEVAESVHRGVPVIGDHGGAFRNGTASFKASSRTDRAF